MVIVHRNPIYSALFLILTLFALAGHFVLLNAPFIAAVHVIVYAGAIMVLFLFVIMLLDLRGRADRKRSGQLLRIIGVLFAGILLVEFGLMLKTDPTFSMASSSAFEAVAGIGDTRSIGELLFTKYLFPFEIASVLLLAAIIGSVILAKRKLK